MLVKGLPGCLAPAKGHRHPYQESIVTMLDGVLAELEAGHRTKIEEAQAKAAAADAERTELVASLSAAEGAAVAQREVCQEHADRL